MKQILLCTVLLLGFGPAALAQSGSPITGFQANDTTMNAAIAAAQDSLPLFLRNALDADGYNLPGANLKVSFPVNVEGKAEHEIIWITPFRSFGDGDFAGLLSNQPHFMGDLIAGDRVDFKMHMIRDWSFWTGKNTSFGNFTTRVIAKTLPDKQRKQLMAQFEQTPIPTEWK